MKKVLCRLCIIFLTLYAIFVSIVAGYWRGYAQAVEDAQATRESIALQQGRKHK